MTTRFLLVREEEVRQLRKLVAQATELLAQLQSHGVAELAIEPRGTGSGTAPETHVLTPKPTDQRPAPDQKPEREEEGETPKKYKVSRSFGYADVVASEFAVGTRVTIDAATERVRQTAQLRTERIRDSVRRAMNEDDRFQRVAENPLTWLRVDGVNEQGDLVANS